MRVALLSHRGGNIGHDFMAAGWQEIIRTAFGAETAIRHVEQHQPFALYGRHPVRLLDRIPNGRARRLRRYVTRPDVRERLVAHAEPPQVDLAVACGGPNIVAGAGGSPEMAAMFHSLPFAFTANGVPVLDAAVGSAYAWQRRPDVIGDPLDRAFWQMAFAVTAGGTVRDRLAQQLWRELGRDAPLIPCGAIAVGRRLTSGPPAGTGGQQTVVVNFQERGANTDWGQHVDPAWWLETVRSAVRRLESRHRVVLLCHNTWEARLASRLGVAAEIRQPTTLADYAAAIGDASAGFVSRLHAAIPLAGCGVPSLVVGTDTRLLAAEQMGLPVQFVKEVTAEGIEAQVEELLARRATEHDRLIGVRETTIASYVDVLHHVVRSA